ncbi:MAG TPA: response regulator transcription factor, partial [Spirochaetes bacterium]|nr:response regulator transcription factor [Spirochaetota bacterium]
MTKEKPRVLVADDDQPVQETLQDLLSRQYHVEGLGNGEDVLKYLETHPALDLLILDIMMPKMNGFQVLAQMKQLDLPVLILSAKSNISDQIKGITLGAWQYATKPFNIQVLITQVHTLVKLGRTIKSLKGKQQAEESQKKMAEEVVERLKKELIELTSRVHRKKKDIDSYKVNRHHLTPDDVFEG